MKKALITGITGQDGSYLSELLLAKNYEVYGLIRRRSNLDYGQVSHLKDKIHFIDGDMTDLTSLINAVKISQPDEVYNLAAQSFVGTSWSQPILTMEVNGIGCANILEAIRLIKPNAKFYQASTSELFGGINTLPQDENTVFAPKSPYAISKLCAHNITENYRESYGMFACAGILFNHESERRGYEFVTRKITSGIAKIKAGKQEYIELGNLDAKRDWGYSKDYVEAMWLMLQQDKPDDYIIATNESHSVREYAELAFHYAGIDIEWQGNGINEIAIDKNNKRIVLKVNPKYFRPVDVVSLQGNAAKANKILNWKPRHNFSEIVRLMVENDLKLENVKL